MKTLTLLITFTLFLNISSCENPDVKNSNLSPCDTDESWIEVGQDSDLVGTVTTLPKLFPPSEYFILLENPPQSKGYKYLPLAPCNLPDEFKKENVKILFSGKFMWIKLPEGIAVDMSTQKFELSSVRLNNLQK